MEVVSSIDTTIRESPETVLKQKMREQTVPEECESTEEITDDNFGNDDTYYRTAIFRLQVYIIVFLSFKMLSLYFRAFLSLQKRC